ncbi:enoyl-CoA hydratase-related protein [Streptacidiphilus monticola]
MADSGELVQTRRHGRVLEVRICREERRNAVDRRVADGLDAAFNLLEDDPKLWVGVLTGTGRVFSAGSDLTAGGDYVTERGGAYGLVRRQRRKPLIAAVEGAALGGGLELVLACDLVVASTSARFGLPEVKLGLVARCGGLFRGPRALPVNLAREMVLTGDPIDAQRAHAHGLVNRLTAPGHALPTALELADRICDNSPPRCVLRSPRWTRCCPVTTPPRGRPRRRRTPTRWPPRTRRRASPPSLSTAARAGPRPDTTSAAPVPKGNGAAACRWARVGNRPGLSSPPWCRR